MAWIRGTLLGRCALVLGACAACTDGSGGLGPDEPGPGPEPAPEPVPTAVANLASALDRFHGTFDVYTDADAAGNHFVARGRMSSPGDEDAVEPMNERFPTSPRSGHTSIRAVLRGRGDNWGGWVFLNGVLGGSDSGPRENWGDRPGAGLDLRGATRLTFWVRGERGNELVRFFAFGIGHPGAPYRDSSPQVSTDTVRLGTEWQRLTMEVSGRDLSYCLGGFGWVASARENGGRDVVFYIDDIQYDLARREEPRFLVSYETLPDHPFDIASRNVAYTYDNAVALLAFLAASDTARARLIADAFVYAQEHDRTFTDGRLRNAYQAGDLTLPPGWNPNGKQGTVRLPGRSDPSGQWLEDEYHVSTHTGNVAWAMLALLGYYESTGRAHAKYLAAARGLGDWVVACCRDARGRGGFRAGFAGRDGNPSPLAYKTTEHNLDLYAAFRRLYLITGETRWRDHAGHARGFVESMWDPAAGKFWSGVGDDGVTTERRVIPVDAQAWAVLALRGEERRYERALAFAESDLRVGGGFDFNQDRDGVWYEGTAHVAAAYAATRADADWRSLIANLRAAQAPSGGLFAADRDGLTTGFNLPDGRPWLYYHRVHAAATAWLVLAAARANPFWLGSSAH